MPQQYSYERYHYRSEWRIRRWPVRVVSLGVPWDIRRTGPSVIVETGLDRVSSVFALCRLIDARGPYVVDGEDG